MTTELADEAVTIHLTPDACAELDALAHAMDRDRSSLITEAIAAYLDRSREFADRIKEGLRQAEAGEFATAAEVATVFE